MKQECRCYMFYEPAGRSAFVDKAFIQHAVVWPFALLLAVMLPLIGVHLKGQDIHQYMEFPPLTRYVQHAGFSWIAFVALAVGILAVVLPFEWRVFRSRAEVENKPPQRTFPWWGWLGLFCGIISWTLAWTRFPWFSELQEFTFSPIWFSYIIVVNALTYRRTGRCMITHRPLLLLGLFVLSAGFWWYFEYLNRFVQNWYYENVGALTPLKYFLFATLPFSTVLPAVLGTYELLRSYRKIGAGLDEFAVLDIRRPKIFAAILLLIAGFGLGALGVWPDYMFPLLWLSPLCIVMSVKVIAGRPTLLDGLRSGKWRTIYLLAMSALICGFFWEMWNFLSLARWVYAVPFVCKFKLFEMPLLGYTGYLPFGLECAVIAELVGFNVNNGSEKDGDI